MNDPVLTLPMGTATKVVSARHPKPTAAELYASVRRASKLRAINTLRQIDAGQKMRLRVITERDAAFSFLAKNFYGLGGTTTEENIKYAQDVVGQSITKLKRLPSGDRRTRRYVAREVARAQRRLTKTEFRVAT